MSRVTPSPAPAISTLFSAAAVSYVAPLAKWKSPGPISTRSVPKIAAAAERALGTSGLSVPPPLTHAGSLTQKSAADDAAGDAALKAHVQMAAARTAKVRGAAVIGPPS